MCFATCILDYSFDMTSAYINYKQSLIHYLYYGKGSTNIVCLHGYGESALSFRSLIEHLPAEFLLVAIDLPLHGTTHWNEKKHFKVEDLYLILNKIFEVLNIKQQHFILAGYSMGGRIAMSLLQYIPERISKLILLAPDGLKVNFWYWLFTQTHAGNRIFRFAMNNPGGLLRLLQILNHLKMANKSVIKFVCTYIEDEKMRNQIFNRLTCMREFKPDLNKIRTIIHQKQLPVRMLYGQYDQMILIKRADKFRLGMESLCKLAVINTGHQVLQQKYGCKIIELMTT